MSRVVLPIMRHQTRARRTEKSKLGKKKKKYQKENNRRYTNIRPYKNCLLRHGIHLHIFFKQVNATLTNAHTSTHALTFFFKNHEPNLLGFFQKQATQNSANQTKRNLNELAKIPILTLSKCFIFLKISHIIHIPGLSNIH